jgi:hypothetical protein
MGEPGRRVVAVPRPAGPAPARRCGRRHEGAVRRGRVAGAVTGEGVGGAARASALAPGSG